MHIRLLVVFLLCCCQAFAAGHQKVILISIDGLRGRTLASLPTRQLHTPNLLEFVQRGAVADGLTGVAPHKR